MTEIVTGDDSNLPVNLYKKDATGTDISFTIAPTATVKASLISADKAQVLIAPVTCLEAAAGADWANSLVIIPFTSADTVGVKVTGDALVEIQVDDGGKLTWFTGITISRGTIA